MSEYINIFKFCSKVSCALFAGVALDILVQHYTTGSYALDHFQHMFKIAAPIQTCLSMFGGLSCLTVYYLQRGNQYLYSGLMMVAILPYTLIGMMPTNNYLMDSQTKKYSEKTKALLKRWKKLHSVRVLMSIGAVSLLSCN